MGPIRLPRLLMREVKIHVQFMEGEQNSLIANVGTNLSTTHTLVLRDEGPVWE